MENVKKGMLMPVPEWWKHFSWLGRAFSKAERQAAKPEAEAEVASELVVWRRDAPYEQAWVVVIQRSDGLFYFIEEKQFYIEDDGIIGPYTCVAPTNRSGLYGNLDDAVRDAMVEVSWLLRPDDGGSLTLQSSDTEPCQGDELHARLHP